MGGGGCVAGVHAWWGACVVGCVHVGGVHGGGMHGRGAVHGGGGHARQEAACMAGGACVAGGGGVRGRYYEIRSMSGRYPSY